MEEEEEKTLFLRAGMVLFVAKGGLEVHACTQTKRVRI